MRTYLIAPAICCILCIIYEQAFSQKLPAKQEKSVWLSQVKAPERENKWNLPYEAYNPSTEIFYTIANDDKNLYLVVKAAHPLIIEKIVGQRLTFKVKSKNGDLLTKFPLLAVEQRQGLVGLVRSKELNGLTNAGILAAKKDSLAKVLNLKYTPSAKQILVDNSSNFQDSIMSIYNEAGIMADHHFTSDLSYVYELTIPLSLFNASAASREILEYTIQINGSEENGIVVKLSPDGKYISRSGAGGLTVEMTTTPELLAVGFPTKFSGDYVLASENK